MERRQVMTNNKYEISFWDDKYVLELDKCIGCTILTKLLPNWFFSETESLCRFGWPETQQGPPAFAF